MIYQNFKSNLIKSDDSHELPKLKEKTIDFSLVASINVNGDANHVIFRNKKGIDITRLSVGHASSGNGPEQKLCKDERLLGIYGSFDNEHKFIKSLGFIVWTPPDLV